MQKILKIFFCLCLTFSIILVIAYHWLYKMPMTKKKILLLQNLPIAIGLVGDQKVYISDLQDCQKNHKQILNQEKSLAECFYVVANQKQTNQIIYNLKIDTSEEKLVLLTKWLKNHDVSFQNTLNKYNLDQANFKKSFLTQYFNELNLKIWYNSQAELNKLEYSSAKQAISDIKNQKKISEIAQQYGGDEFALKVNGNLDYIESEKLLWEISSVLEMAEVGTTQIIPSREGVNVVKLVGIQPAMGDETKKYKIQSITYRTKGFEEWLQEEKQKILIYQYIKLI